MQIQSINNSYYNKSNPNFKANHLRTAVQIAAKNNRSDTVIDIFSLNKTDKVFINRVLEAIKGQKFSDDVSGITPFGVKETLKTALKKALTLGDYTDDGVYLAIENKKGQKSIAGILDFSGEGDYRLKGCAVWNSENPDLVRSNMFSQLLLSKGIRNQFMRKYDNEKDLLLSGSGNENFLSWLKKAKLLYVYNFDKLKFFGNRQMIILANHIDAKNQMNVKAYPGNYEKNLLEVLDIE